MTVLPIVARELRVSSRRWATYILRLGAATSAIALAALIYLFVSRSSTTPAAEIGKVIFVVLSSFAFLYALLIGVRVTSDCVSSEKREGTLGLLFLTDLKGVDIVLGKLVASALDSIYALISTLPVLAIPILLGSVTAGEIWRTMLSLLVTALFSVCAGLFVSTFSINERKATAGTFLLVCFLAAGVPILLLIFQYYLGNDDWFSWFFSLSPGTSMVAALVNKPFAGELTRLYWNSIGVTAAYAVVLAAVAALAVPHIWQQRVEGRRNGGDGAAAPGDARRRQERNQLLDVSPTCWLVERAHLRGMWLWIFLLVVLCGWLWAFSESPNDMHYLGINLAWMYFVQGVVKVFVASEAVRIYSEDHRQGALELILCTPLGVNEIVRGQLFALFRYFRWPMIALLGTDLLFLAFGRTTGVGNSREIYQMFASMMVFFVLDAAAISIVGLWHGLVARNSRQALTSTLVRILVLPWILYGLANLSAMLGLDREIPGKYQLPMAFCLSLAVNGFFSWQAWDQLHRQLRSIAAARYGGGRGRSIWYRLGRAWSRLAGPVSPG